MKWQEYPYVFEGFETQFNRVLNKKQELDSFRPIPSIVLKSIRESLMMEWTYNSNAIEGNSLTLQETKLVLEEGITIGGKTLREHFETMNHQEAIYFIEELARKNNTLTAKDILDVHRLVLNNIEREYAGRFRVGGVRIGGANFVPPNALKVPDLTDELINWYNSDDNKLPAVIKSTIFHHRFVWIHPFFDGNGRTVRLAFNLLLMKEGFPPAIILKNDRKKYYAALNQANNGDYSKLMLIVLQAIERSLDIYLAALNDNSDDYQPISSIVSEPDIPYGLEYVSLLARRGKIAAHKEGNTWHTTTDAVKEYMSLRERKRKSKNQ
jgi:Fic family protein